MELLLTHQTAGQPLFRFSQQAVPIFIGAIEVLPRGMMAVFTAEYDVAAMKTHGDLPLKAFVVPFPPSKFHAGSVLTGIGAASSGILNRFYGFALIAS